MKNLWQIAQKINTDHCLILFDEPMKEHTTFKIGGPADLFIRPRSISALEEVVGLLKIENVPFFILGSGANILVGDRGVRGAVIDTSLLSSIMHLKREERIDPVLLYAECGVRLMTLCEEAQICGLSGLENFYGMPGSLGGSVYMNARCYEDDIATHIQDLTIIDNQGRLKIISARAQSWSYKRSPFMRGGELESLIICAASFRLIPDDPEKIAERMRLCMRDRMQKRHFNFPSAGSMFKNNHDFGKPTGKILDELGLRNYRIGDAAISPWHANIFVNIGKASARDMRKLIEYAQKVVYDATGFCIEPEVLFIGEF